MSKRAARPLALPVIGAVLMFVLIRTAMENRNAPPAGPAPAGKASVARNVLTGKVVHIADGDTLTLLDASNVQHRIRLYGIDAPEHNQAFGTKAKAALAGKVAGREVEVENTATDRYGRIVGKVYLDGRLINEEMVADGWAWDYVQYDRQHEFAAAESAARIARRGLWSDSAPTPPWEFRKAERADHEQGFTERGTSRNARVPRGIPGPSAGRTGHYRQR